MTRVGGRLPWVLWSVAMLVLAATLTLTIRNGSVSEDPTFITIAMIMILGYSTGGALLASRNPANPLGWLMMVVGGAFAITGLSDEYARYTYLTEPGSLPAGPIAAALSTLLWMPMIAALILLLLLFPTGRPPGPRWRLLPPTVVGLTALNLVGTVLHPGPLDLEYPIRLQNPLGVEGLGLVTGLAQAIGGIGLPLMAAPAVAGLILRYRRSRGEERQQIRWLVYVAAITATVILLGIAMAVAMGESYATTIGDAVFLITVALIGIGAPAAIGVAVLRYRLYDLDLVVKKTVVFAVTGAAITLAALLVAIAAPVLVLGADPADLAPIAAGVAIGFLMSPLRARARRWADRLVYGRRATPYEVLAEFSERVGEAYAADDVLPRMAAVLGGAVGAARARVWLRVGRELRPAAAWPGDDGTPGTIPVAGDEPPAFPADEAATEVRHRGELLGALSVTMPANDPLDPSRERLVRDLAAQAGLVLRNVSLIEELRESRRRIVSAQDERAKRLERNIHDGAQQQLVALTVKLRLAEQLVARDPEGARRMLEQLQGEANAALEDLRDLARGVYPPLLADEGLPAALSAQARKSPVPVAVEADGIDRYPRDVESTVFFCTLEALQNVTKYAGASRVTVRLRASNGWLSFEVADDGAGFDPAATSTGTGLQGMADRVEAIGGSLEIRSAPGRGTTVIGRVPVAQATPAASAQAEISRSGPKAALGM